MQFMNLSFSPDLIGDLAHQSQLLLLVVHAQGVSTLVRAESALWAHGNLLEGLLLGLTSALGDELSSLVDALLHLLLVLELAELSGNDTDNNVLVLRQELEGFEAAGTLSVVLQVEGVDVQVGEELLGDDVVGTLGKVTATNEVAAAQVDTGVHVSRNLADGVVVQLDVGVKQLIDSADVVLVLGPSLAELFGAEVCVWSVPFFFMGY